MGFLENGRLLDEMEIHLVSVASAASEPEALSALRGAEAELTGAGLDPIVQMLHGSAPSAIARYAEESGIDILLMGSHSHCKLRRLSLGSTTSEVLRDCRFPAFLYK